MEHLDATFSALADPTRRAIVARLALGDATVMELAKPFSMSQASSRADAMRSGGPADWRSNRSPTPVAGSTDTARSGNRTSASSTSFWRR
jgi:DNA-binding transcriptional ArsR family regulator